MGFSDRQDSQAASVMVCIPGEFVGGEFLTRLREFLVDRGGATVHLTVGATNSNNYPRKSGVNCFKDKRGGRGCNGICEIAR